jgi:hypothetical protein
LTPSSARTARRSEVPPSHYEDLADLVIGNIGFDDPSSEEEQKYFPHRSSAYITEFIR